MKTYYLILLVMMVACQIGCLGLARLSIHCQDVDGQPAANVPVRIGFYTGTPKLGPGTWGRTDKNGNYVSTGPSAIYSMCSVAQSTADGWYPTRYRYFYDAGVLFNSTTVTVKRVHHPCAMYHWYIEKKIPVESKLIGFDCVACDWVKPYGTGTNTDFLTALIDHSTQAKPDDIAFVFQGVGPNDGFIKYTKDDWSELKWIYEAPVDGNYTNRYAVYSNAKVNHEVDHNSYLVVRCRTVTNETGKIVSAHYGFIGGSIHYDYERKFSCGIYFNPRPNDRNLEYDYKQQINKEDMRR